MVSLGKGTYSVYNYRLWVVSNKGDGYVRQIYLWKRMHYSHAHTQWMQYLFDSKERFQTITWPIYDGCATTINSA